MLIYSVTVTIDRTVHDDWLQWLRQQHIPDVLNTGCFTGHKLCRVLKEEANGITYAIQYTCPDRQTLERYQREFAPGLQAAHTARYKGRFTATRALLEVVSG